MYNRISNLRQKTTKRRLNEEHYLATVSKKHTEPPNVVEDSCVKDAVIWLEQNSKPWATVLDKWAASFKARKVQLAKPNSGPNLLKRYQLYSNEFGYQLVNNNCKNKIYLAFRTIKVVVSTYSLQRNRKVLNFDFKERYFKEKLGLPIKTLSIY